MPYTVAARIRRWIFEAEPVDDFQSIHEMVEYFAQWRYTEYVPTIGAYPDFWTRLRNWLDCLSHDEDQKTLFRLLPHIFFVTKREFETLYRTAMRGIIVRWIIDVLGIRFDTNDLDTILQNAMRETWFCPITDSMQIADFCHANRIEGQQLRPDWLTLTQLGESESILNYVERNGVKRLVLLEDFVGSGSQIKTIINSVATLLASLQILVVPLIVCPSGVSLGEDLEQTYHNLRFSPVISLPSKLLISRIPNADEPRLFSLVRELIIRSEDIVKTPSSTAPYYGPFGYRETGALVVPYSNCPDNTLPIIHYESESWRPLFPRSSRE